MKTPRYSLAERIEYYQNRQAKILADLKFVNDRLHSLEMEKMQRLLKLERQAFRDSDHNEFTAFMNSMTAEERKTYAEKAMAEYSRHMAVKKA